MPLYEWECLACEITFEDLATIGEGRRQRACPSCGRSCPRVVSTFAIASGAAPEPQPSASAAAAGRAAKAPICLRYPHIPLLCHMDQPTAERAVAYAHGRGAEYDDRKGQAEEMRKKRGLPPPAPPAPSGHAHAHDPRRHKAADAVARDHAAGGHTHTHADAAGDSHGAGGVTRAKRKKAASSAGASPHAH